MDILTPKGQESLQWETEAVSIFEMKYPIYEYCHTPKDKAALVDGVLLKNDVIDAVVEVKCRPTLTLAKFRSEYDNQWLVTFEKITKAAEVANALQVPFVGWLYLPAEKTLLFKTIWRPVEGFVADLAVTQSKTARTINGGSVMRANAYIDMKDAKILSR